MPCNDIDDGSDSHMSTEFSSRNDTRDKQIELCSPFCACNYCSTHVFIYFAVTALYSLIVIRVIKISLPTYKSISSSNFFGSIWQPPQIV